MKEQACKRCKKLTTDYPRARTDALQGLCRSCNHTERSRLSGAKRRAIAVDMVNQYKVDVGCQRCHGVFHPSKLQYHHKIPSTKAYVVSEMAWRPFSLPAIKAEMDKCEVLCKGCHSAEHGYNSAPWGVKSVSN